MQAKLRALAFDFFLPFLMSLGCFFTVLSLCLLFRCLQSMSEKEVEVHVLIILQARIAVNKKVGQKHIPLSKNAKDAVLKKSRLHGFWMVLDYLLSVSGYGQKLKD